MTPSSTSSLRSVLLAATLACTAACGEDPFGPLTQVQPAYEVGTMVFTAESEVPDPDGRTLNVTVRVVNEGLEVHEVAILGGPCMLRPRLYDNADGSLEWSTFEPSQTCGDETELIELEPGGERILQDSFTADVSAGSYFVTVTIHHLDLIELSAGAAVFR